MGEITIGFDPEAQISTEPEPKDTKAHEDHIVKSNLQYQTRLKDHLYQFEDSGKK